MTTLSKEDKVQIISSHMRNLDYRKYGIELDILVENAKASSSAEALSKFQESLSEINSQLDALNEELLAVNAE